MEAMGTAHGRWKRGQTVFISRESGEGLCSRAFPDRGDAKPGGADTCNQITQDKIKAN